MCPSQIMPSKMVLDCICEGVNNHKSLKSFLKCVNFLLKHIVKNSTIYDARDQLFYDENSKCLTWKKIASGYIQEYMLLENRNVVGDCQKNGCSLKILQKTAQYLLQCIATCQNDFAELTLENGIGQCVADDIILPLPHMETFSNDLTYMLECIVANPSLYDKENLHFDDEEYKFKVWNEVCSIYYDEPGSVAELIGVSDEIKLQFYQKFAERLLQRIASPLSVNINTKAIETTSAGGDSGDSGDSGDMVAKQDKTISIRLNQNECQTVNIIFTK